MYYVNWRALIHALFENNNAPKYITYFNGHGGVKPPRYRYLPALNANHGNRVSSVLK
ncbi:protein of unknown function [Moritella yayanosii]|uniref:Uncharacterized protein n=1 Tax=Moritella yayanosii TaxID=69539 RepID=A0A330LZH0_9GAMM|nr:protein of unknown function [Moritella yayanosii]